MADLVGMGVLAFGVDGTEFITGMAQIAQVADKTAADVAGAAGKMGTAMDGAAQATGEATGKMDAASRRLISQLQREADTFGMSKLQIMEYNAAKLGISALTAPLVEQIRAKDSAATEAARVEAENARIRASEEATAAAVKKAAADKAKAAQDAAEAAAAAAEKFVQAQQREADAIGLTRIQRLERQADQMGVRAQVEPALQRMRDEESRVALDAENARIKASADQAAADIKRAEDAKAKALQATADAAKRAADEFVQAQMRMADEIGKSRIEKLEMQADRLGVRPQLEQSFAKMRAEELRASAAAKDAEVVRSTEKAQAESRALVQQIERETMQLTLSRSEYLAWRAAQAGASTEAAPFIAKLREMEGATTKLGLSTRQHAAAMRLLPAQISDIVVSLVSGQPAYLVAIQQGAQLKDSFGGVGNAARAMLSVFTPMRLVVGGAAAAVALLATAYYQGAQEADAFNRAIANTGNILGVTTGQLNAMAAAVGSGFGNQAQAAEVIAALASSGDVAVKSMQAVTTAVLAATSVGGRDLKEMVKNFSDLGREPVEASVRLNAQYRYLTLAVYDAIKAQMELGNTVRAAEIAQGAYAAAETSRNNQVLQNLGSIERSWLDIKKAAAGAWSAMLNIGREVSADDALAKAQERLGRMSAGGSQFGRYSQSEIDAQRQVVANLEQQATAARAVAAAVGEEGRNQQAALAARRANAQWTEAAITNQEKREAALKTYRDNNKALDKVGQLPSPEQIRREEAAIREKFRDKAGPKGPKVTDDAATRMLQNLRQTEAALNAQLAGEEKLGAAARARVEFEQQIADLKVKPNAQLTDEQKSLLAAQDAIRLQLQKNEAIETEIAMRDLIAKSLEKEQKALDKFLERSAQLQQQMRSSRQSRQEQYERTLGGLGLGDQARSEIEAQRGLFREAERAQAELLEDTPEWMLGSDKYITESMKIKEALDASLADHRAYYDALRAAQGDWAVGQSQAINNYLEQAADVASQTERLYSTAFNGLEDSLTSFITTGKGGFTELGNVVVAEVTRMIIRMQILGPMLQSMKVGGGVGGAASGILGSLMGGIFPTKAPVPSLLSLAGGSPFAMGGVFSPSGVTPVAKGGVTEFAAGDIVSQPTYFGYGNGKSGVMGEAGYEAIMPVARTAKGELGVKVAGNGGGGGQQYHVHLHGFKGEAGELRRSSTQIAGTVAGAISRSRRGA